VKYVLCIIYSTLGFGECARSGLGSKGTHVYLICPGILCVKDVLCSIIYYTLRCEAAVLAAKAHMCRNFECEECIV